MRRSSSLGLAIFLLASLSAPAATWYVRSDGGTSTQCTGLANAAYPGSGTAQACALAHPFWALDVAGVWRIAAGDTLVIGSGSYRIGWGAPNTGWCDVGGTWGCTFPPLPSGPSAGTPTRLVGSGWDTGCPAKPQLYGVERVDQVASLNGTSNAVVACLEITDHSSCVEFHASPSVACVRDTYPHGDWASNGLYAADSSNVTLQDLDLHGLASQGVLSGRLSDWSVTDVRIAGNGSAGWNGDLGGPSSNSGSLVFNRLTVEWNGCSETYPGLQYADCWAQQAGGYGDGLGTASTGGNWVFTDSVFRYNTSDGLDLLYLGVGGQTTTLSISGMVAVGNAGNQIKVAGPADIVNTLAIGNCAYFSGKPFATLMVEGDQCRALGATLALSPHRGNRVRVFNSTIVGEGDCLLSVECATGGCDGTEDVQLRNNALRGYVDWRQPWEQACYMWDPSGFLLGGRNDTNVVHDVKDTTSHCASGPANLCGVDPLFVNGSLYSLDGHLQAGSPARDSGLAVGSFGMVPALDIEGIARPQGSAVDRGAYEYRSCLTTSASRFRPLTPCRLLDTRGAAGPLGGPSLSASQTRTFSLAGVCGVPTAAKALSGNLTVVNPAAAGLLRAYAGDGAVPITNSLSFPAGRTRANNGLFQLACDGGGTLKVENASAGTADVLLDVNGYFE